MMQHLKVGDTGTISVKVITIDVTGRWVTFNIAGYAHPVTMYEPAIEITQPAAPGRRKKGAAHQRPPE